MFLFMETTPFAYLMTDAKACTPSTWDISLYSYNFNDDSLYQRYFETTNGRWRTLFSPRSRPPATAFRLSGKSENFCSLASIEVLLISWYKPSLIKCICAYHFAIGINYFKRSMAIPIDNYEFQEKDEMANCYIPAAYGCTHLWIYFFGSIRNE